MSDFGSKADIRLTRPAVFLIARGISVEEVVGEAGGVGQQMAQRDRSFGGAKLGLALIVEPLQHLRRGKLLEHAAEGDEVVPPDHRPPR